MFAPTRSSDALARRGIARRSRARCAAPWRAAVAPVLAEATLDVPPAEWMQGAQRGGKQGVHTEHLGHLLAEMQFLQRALSRSAHGEVTPTARERRDGARAAAACRRPLAPTVATRRGERSPSVPDPEIPVVSIVELGIVRDVARRRRRASTWSITPTYSGLSGDAT